MLKTRPKATVIGLIVVLTLAIVVLLYFWQTELKLTGNRTGAPLDDAWIHFQFARNLSQGKGFSYNPGEPTPGSTAPLWTLFLVPAGWLGFDFLPYSLILSAAFFLATVAITYGFSRELIGSRLAAGLAAIGVILSGRLVWAGLAGMETTAFTAFSLAAVWLYSRRGFDPLSALLFGLASQLRPEGHFLFALVVLDTGWQTVVHGRNAGNMWLAVKGKLTTFLLSAAMYGLLAAPYAVFSLTTTGKPLPNTFYAKSGTENFFSWQTLRETVALHWRDNPVSLLLLPFGLWAVWPRSRVTAGWLLGLPLLSAVVVDFVWHHGRYTMPLIPFQMIVAAAGATWLIVATRKRLARFGSQETKWNQNNRQVFQMKYPAVVLGVVLSIALILAGLWRLNHWATMLGENVSEILDVDLALGEWLAANTPPDALVAVDDIGAITFVSQRRIVDMNGLVTPEMWPAIEQPIGLPRNLVATRILSGLDPDYIVAFPLWHWEIVTNPAVSQQLHQVQASTRTILPQQDVIVSRVTWPYIAEANPQVEVDAILGDAIQFLGYDLQLLPESHALELSLYWQSLSPVAAEYDVFIHIVDSADQIVAQADQQPLHGLAPTSFWQPGDIINDPYKITLPPDLPAGDYNINVGMFLRDTGIRLPAAGSQTTGDTILLGSFEWPG